MLSRKYLLSRMDEHRKSRGLEPLTVFEQLTTVESMKHFPRLGWNNDFCHRHKQRPVPVRVGSSISGVIEYCGTAYIRGGDDDLDVVREIFIDAFAEADRRMRLIYFYTDNTKTIFHNDFTDIDEFCSAVEKLTSFHYEIVNKIYFAENFSGAVPEIKTSLTSIRDIEAYVNSHNRAKK